MRIMRFIDDSDLPRVPTCDEVKRVEMELEADDEIAVKILAWTESAETELKTTAVHTLGQWAGKVRERIATARIMSQGQRQLIAACGKSELYNIRERRAVTVRVSAPHNLVELMEVVNKLAEEYNGDSSDPRVRKLKGEKNLADTVRADYWQRLRGALAEIAVEPDSFCLMRGDSLSDYEVFWMIDGEPTEIPWEKLCKIRQRKHIFGLGVIDANTDNFGQFGRQAEKAIARLLARK